MVPKPELIKGGGGSIRIGTTGTISSLITKELDYRSGAPAQPPISSRRKPPIIPVSVPSASTSKTSLQRRRTSNEASSSSSSSSMSNINRRNPGTTQKARQNDGRKNTHNIPMLGSEDIPLERTPYRSKPNKKKPNIVEVVDIKCGKTEKAWSTPISNRLKKLGFSKLSVSIG